MMVLPEATQDAQIKRDAADIKEAADHPRGVRLQIWPMNANNIGRDTYDDEIPDDARLRIETPHGEVCTKCKHDDIAKVHRDGDALAPECDYKMCPNCWHEWNHT